MKFFDDILAKKLSGGSTPTGTIPITTNGEHDVTDYATADVQVPQPAGKTTITQNGTDLDIAQYATADVQVPLETISILGYTQQPTEIITTEANTYTVATEVFDYFLGDANYVIANAIDPISTSTTFNVKFITGGKIGSSQLYGAQIRVDAYGHDTGTAIGAAAGSRLEAGIRWQVTRFI